MGLSLSNLSGSELRKLALSEVREFIALLDGSKTEQLQHKKAYLSEIFARLTEKEQEELQHLMSLVSEIATSSQHASTPIPTAMHQLDPAPLFPADLTQSNTDSSVLEKSA